MGADLFRPIDRLLGFLLVLARVAGVFVFVPLPGCQQLAGNRSNRAVAGHHHLPASRSGPPATGLDQSIARLAGYTVMDAAVGMVLGLTVSFPSRP